MEDKKLREIFEEYTAKLDANLSLNVAFLEKLKLEKTKQQTQTITVFRSIEVVFFSVAVLVLGKFVATNWGVTHLVISGLILHIFALIALIGSIGQLVLVSQINYANPIVKIREKIEKVNTHSLLFIKLAFLSAPVWWAYPIVALAYFFNFDLYSYLDTAFVQRYLIINGLIVIPLIGLLLKVSYRNMHIKWVSKTINFLASSNTKKALQFLNEIKEFKK